MNATQNRDLFNSDNNPTTSSIKRAISSNHHVQSEVINRLAKISQRKIENREMAHDCWLAMERLWIKKHEISTPKMLNEAFSREFYSSYQKHHASLMKATPDRCKDDESVMLEKEALRRAQVQNGGLESDDKEASCERNNEKSAVSRSVSRESYRPLMNTVKCFGCVLCQTFFMTSFLSCFACSGP